MDDAHLLRQYVDERSEAAFTALMRRHIDLVYFSALRRTCGDAHRAEDVVQQVFSALAAKAAALTSHAALTGWLYTATQHAAHASNRAEARRRERENKAHAMNEIQTDAGHDPDWEAVRPVIDDALADLKPRDREAVLLRFFQNRSHAEVGAVLQLTENSARMCVERALERLRAALARRGVTSTTAALITALAVPAASAAPAGLVPQIAAAVLAGGSVAGAGVSLLTVMTTTKLAFFSTGAAALLALGIAAHQHRQLAAARAESAEIREREEQLHALVENLEGRLAAAQERAAGLEAARLAPVASASPAAGGDAGSIAPPTDPVTRDMVEARLKRARELASRGEQAEALREFLWCYDVGTRQVEGYFIYRYTSLLQAIADLGRGYPPALDALRQRRDAAVQRLIASETDMAAGKDLSQINRVLGEDAATHALFDGLAEDDPRRAHLVDVNIGRLMEAQRYRELARAMPYDGIPQVWEQMTQQARSPAGGEAAQANRTRNVVRFAAQQIELRAGAGDTVYASDMIERALVFDNSPETIETIRRHLQRAGHPDLLTVP